MYHSGSLALWRPGSLGSLTLWLSGSLAFWALWSLWALLLSGLSGSLAPMYIKRMISKVLDHEGVASET